MNTFVDNPETADLGVGVTVRGGTQCVESVHCEAMGIPGKQTDTACPLARDQAEPSRYAFGSLLAVCGCSH